MRCSRSSSTRGGLILRPLPNFITSILLPHTLTPPPSKEDAGAVIAVVLDTRRPRSFLLCLDARTLAPLARAWLPHAAPAGRRGRFLPAAQMLRAGSFDHI